MMTSIDFPTLRSAVTGGHVAIHPHKVAARRWIG